jgi:hypothetical protein
MSQLLGSLQSERCTQASYDITVKKLSSPNNGNPELPRSGIVSKKDIEYSEKAI